MNTHQPVSQRLEPTIAVETSLAHDILNALAASHRRAIFLWLAQKKQACVGDISKAFPEISRPACSQHLRILLKLGLVSYHQKGVQHIYMAEAARIVDLSLWLTAIQDQIACPF